MPPLQADAINELAPGLLEPQKIPSEGLIKVSPNDGFAVGGSCCKSQIPLFTNPTPLDLAKISVLPSSMRAKRPMTAKC